MNINPLDENLSSDDLFEGFNYLIENNGIIQKETFQNLIKKKKRVILGILAMSNKYNIKIENEHSQKDLLNALFNSSDITDYGIAHYIDKILDGKIINQDIKRADMEKLSELSDEVSFFWSVSNGWKPLEIGGNIKKVLGYEKSDFFNEKVIFSEIIHPDDLIKIEKEVENNTLLHLDKFEQIYRLRKKDGQYIKVKDKTICKYDDQGEILYYYGFITDITKEDETDQKLQSTMELLESKHLINDKTGLPNKNQLCIDLEKYNRPILFLLKIKNFGEINTLYGFDKGDQILNLIITKLQEELKQLGLKLYTIGNSTNFGVASNCSGKKELLNKKIQSVENILKGFSINTDYGVIHVNMAGGVVCSKEDTYDKALMALYTSKNKGDQIIRYDENIKLEMKESSQEHITWISKIIEGIKNDKFYPVYQGIHNNITGKIDKYEALIRLDDEGKEISPIKFLDYAEQIGKSTELTMIMLKKVISEMSNHDNSVSINITKQDLENENMINIVSELLLENNINPERLTLEILETITTDGEELILKIKELKKIGIKISIDDFGTGYSNFARLMDIDADFLKIDGSLIKGIANDPKQIQVLRLIQDLAKIKNAQTIAEFVDNQEVQNIIETLGINYTQGYLFSKPTKNPFN